MNASRPRQICALTAGACALALAAMAPAGLAAAGLAPAAQAQSLAARSVLPGTHPAWAIPARIVAAPDITGSISARVFLAGHNPAGLASYATAVSDPASRSFRKFITSAQEEQRFGPTAAQVSAVRAWLASAGMRVTAVTRHYVAVTGSVQAADTAFAVRIASFRGPDGAVAMAPEQNASVPAAIGSAVLTVLGLDTATVMMQPAIAGQVSQASPAGVPSAFYTVGPCSRYYGQRRATSVPTAYGKHVPWAICGYRPQQLRGAYGLTSRSSTGLGVTVAVVDAYYSPYMPRDANTYASDMHFPRFAPGQFRQDKSIPYNNQAECGESGWYQEESLDVEAVHTMAPDATVEYVAATNCTLLALYDALTKVADHDLADVVTDSWTGTEADLTSADASVFNQVFQQGSTEGIGFDFAAGDCGYNSPQTNCGKSEASMGIAANFPTSSTWVTGVGGTSLAIGSKNNYEWETGWGDMVVPLQDGQWKHRPPGHWPGNYSYGGGGGTSKIFPQPTWQAGVVPPKLSKRLPSGRISSTPMRVTPDVALDADPATGFEFGETVKLRNGKNGFQLSRVGGTSLSTPLFAGLEADAAALVSGHELGFINPTLYQLAGTRAFHDVTDSPLGRGVRIALARNEWNNTADANGGIKTSLYTLARNGYGKAALVATKGYDNVTGLGSPSSRFIEDLAAG